MEGGQAFSIQTLKFDLILFEGVLQQKVLYNRSVAEFERSKRHRLGSL
jgi:hypothetical protein